MDISNDVNQTNQKRTCGISDEMTNGNVPYRFGSQEVIVSVSLSSEVVHLSSDVLDPIKSRHVAL